MTEDPTKKAVHFRNISKKFGAASFQDALADYIASVNNPGLGMRAVRTHAANTLLPFRTVRAYHKIKFTTPSDTRRSEIVDVVYVQPELLKDGRITPARFDTALIQSGGQGM